MGDFNKDGHPDLAIVGTLGDLNVLLGRGDGTFGAAVAYHEGIYLAWVAMADFNGDGNTDLAVADYEGESAIVVLGRGDGTFLSVPTYGVMQAIPLPMRWRWEISAEMATWIWRWLLTAPTA